MTQVLYVHTLGFSPNRFLTQVLIQAQNRCMIFGMGKVSHFCNMPETGKGKAMRKTGELIGNDNRVVAIFWDSENREFQVKVKNPGEKHWNENATYFTDDRVDALRTANMMLVE